MADHYLLEPTQATPMYRLAAVVGGSFLLGLILGLWAGTHQPAPTSHWITYQPQAAQIVPGTAGSQPGSWWSQISKAAETRIWAATDGNTSSEARQSINGLETTYVILKEGDGPAVQRRNVVTVHATGVVKETGKTFWSTKDAGQQPFTYQAGVGSVIKGWDYGCLGMQLGEVRSIEIPAAEGYGQGGFPAWGIPPGGTLDFTIEVLKIN
mmetsp:Transcript_108096/g.186565  ORF Transcript_108096/g.186565 Transcript_108096/m.186565 type:complete len:210 (-) Transcript_108096:829-1458(-)